MSLLGEEKNTSYGFVGSISFVELGIPTQLVIHSLAVVESMLNHGLVAEICCLVFTINFFNFSFASQSTLILFFFGS